MLSIELLRMAPGRHTERAAIFEVGIPPLEGLTVTAFIYSKQFMYILCSTVCRLFPKHSGEIPIPYPYFKCFPKF